MNPKETAQVEKLSAYRSGAHALPELYNAWQLFGAGFENLGENGRISLLDLRAPEENEVLLRVDAVGLCHSDLKIIAQGSEHQRLRGRDLAKEPTVLGHECAATVVAAGTRWKDDFTVGQRYIVQADIYYKGVGYAFGYLIPGGLAQYCVLDERALDGDEGSYLIPIADSTGYSQAALSEPWACVEMSYSIEDRHTPGLNGMDLAIVEGPGAENLYEQFPDAVRLPRDAAAIKTGEAAFDDIIVDDPNPELVNALSPKLKNGGGLFLLGGQDAPGTATLDIGAIHYKGIRYFGGGTSLEEVSDANKRSDLKVGGRCLILGGGGPMGQMHVQRAVERRPGPSVVAVTDLDQDRAQNIIDRFGALAEKNGVQLNSIHVTADGEDSDTMRTLNQLSDGLGFDDIIVLAPSPQIVANVLELAADNAVINVFAGIPAGGAGTEIGLYHLCRGIKIIGSSGSRIKDMRDVLGLVESGELDTNLSVTAVGGLGAARDGLIAMRDAVFHGKTIIYPQLRDLPLMSIEEIAQEYPELRETLSPQGAWTIQAEERLLALALEG